MPVSGLHRVLGHAMTPPFPAGMERAVLALGCFWGAERMLWQVPGVWTTASGYSGGETPNPTYEEVCTGRTGHAESVLCVYDPEVVGYETLLARFFEAHDPTQWMRQGNDVGSQYRSAIFATSSTQLEVATAVAGAYGKALGEAGLGGVVTEIEEAGPFYYAEPYHQQYLAQNPDGYCGLAGTGVRCPG